MAAFDTKGRTMFWLLIAILPTEHAVRDRVDVMEVNHCFNDAGVHQYDQVIFWDWSSEHSRYQVRAWRLVKQSDSLPYRSAERDEFVCMWRDRDLFREVRAPLMRETWTCYDPEAIDRETLPETKRLGLTLRRPLKPSVVVAPLPVPQEQADPAHSSSP
jgi:hypothetical protein